VQLLCCDLVENQSETGLKGFSHYKMLQFDLSWSFPKLWQIFEPTRSLDFRNWNNHSLKEIDLLKKCAIGGKISGRKSLMNFRKTNRIWFRWSNSFFTLKNATVRNANWLDWFEFYESVLESVIYNIQRVKSIQFIWRENNWTRGQFILDHSHQYPVLHNILEGSEGLAMCALFAFLTSQVKDLLACLSRALTASVFRAFQTTY
jgi:hypothetical protein